MNMNQHFAYQSMQFYCFYNSIDFVIIVMTQQPGIGNNQEFYSWSVVPQVSSRCTPLCAHSTSLCSSSDHFLRFYIHSQLFQSQWQGLLPLLQERSGVLVISLVYSVLKYFQRQNKLPLWNKKNSCCTTIPFMQMGSIPSCHRPQYLHFISDFFID